MKATFKFKDLYMFYSYCFLFFLSSYAKSISIKKSSVYFQLNLFSNFHLTTSVNFIYKSSFLRCNSLIDIAVVDYIDQYKRFGINYLFVSHIYNNIIQISFLTPFETILPSLTFFFNSAFWAEREVYDMFGLFFINNKDLRRLLTDYGFKGHPLQKNYPLIGYYEIFYFDSTKCVKLLPIEISQGLKSKYIY